MYSQNNEEQIILSHFKDFTGTVLDIGANDGITLSNSRRLVELGWTGILVEPSQTAYKKLFQNCIGFPFAVAFNVAIGSKNGKLKFYESGTHLKQGDTSLLSSLHESETEQWKRSGHEFTETEVVCVTWEKFLQDCPVKKFDVISIDIEGEDFNVLSQMDLNELGCKMLIVETNSKENQKYIAYCHKFGMRLHAKNYQNLIFIR